jgi:hypothetical protein
MKRKLALNAAPASDGACICASPTGGMGRFALAVTAKLRSIALYSKAT